MTTAVVFVTVTVFFAANASVFAAGNVVGAAPTMVLFTQTNRSITERKNKMSPEIRILMGYKKQTDAQLAASAGAVIKGLTGNPAFPNPAVDLKDAQAALDELNVAIAGQPNGGLAGTALKNKKRTEMIAVLNKLGHYVQDHCGGDLSAVVNAGFNVANFTRSPIPLDKPSVASVDFGNTTQLVLNLNRVRRARLYEVEYAAMDANGTMGPWQRGESSTRSRGINVAGLTPWTTYHFRVRAIGVNGPTDWSDSVSHICI